MLDSRLDEFDEQRRFIFSLLGLLSLTDRFVQLSKIRAESPTPAADSNVLDAALGVLSIRRTLTLALTPGPATSETLPAPVRGESEAESPSWLR